MKLNKERIAWLREQLENADYCELGMWAGEGRWDVQQDLEDALDDIAQLEARIKELDEKNKRMYDLITECKKRNWRCPIETEGGE